MYNPNQRNHLDEGSKKRKFSKVVSSLFGALKKGRDDEKTEVKEKIILPSKNGEKVVISRSNGDLVLGVIVGMKNGKYCVHYQIGNTYHTKQLSRDEIENNQKMFNCEEYKSSVKDGPDYKLGEEVIIPRTNKQPSKAYIIGYIPEKGLYMVGFTDTFVREGYTTLHSSGKTEKTGIMKITTTEQYHKLLTKEDLAKYN